jgi:crotonobetainyl-CoA:carnitine CoA-transferase CaiB-like acyl-CoA transferase
LPLLYLITGATVSAINLCDNNLQMAIVSAHKPSSYFAIAAALGGLSGALGTTTGGILAQTAYIGGLTGLFVLSSLLRAIAILPLLFVREPRHDRFVGLAMLRQVMVSLNLRERTLQAKDDW